jgi:hypothetical protein
MASFRGVRDPLERKSRPDALSFGLETEGLIFVLTSEYRKSCYWQDAIRQPLSPMPLASPAQPMSEPTTTRLAAAGSSRMVARACCF